jgi:hypothetical protein
MHVRLFVSGRNYDFAAKMPDQFGLAEDATLDDALRQPSGLLPDGQAFPPSCLLAVSGRHCGTVGSHRPEVLRDGDELVILAPMAGG